MPPPAADELDAPELDDELPALVELPPAVVDAAALVVADDLLELLPHATRLAAETTASDAMVTRLTERCMFFTSLCA
jgi:hypothetical protein